MSMLVVERLSKSFGGLRAVHDLDLTVEEGEIVGIIGPNGSGKTTVLNLITGFLKPDAGRVLFRDEEITGFPRYRVSQRGIARTFQLVKPFLESPAVENVMVGRAYGHAPAKDLAQAERESLEMLELVGLAEKSRAIVKDLTIMQRKRLELARALACRPYLLLLDELMAGLNPSEAEEACGLIRRIRDTKLTIIVVEHIVKAICGLSDRVVVLNMGEKITEGPPDEVIRDPQVVDIYLGKPNA